MKQLPTITSTIINELFDKIDSKYFNHKILYHILYFYWYILNYFKYFILKTDIIRYNSPDTFNGNEISFYFSVLENLLCASDGKDK